ncbi:MAG TPA: TonB family protein [Nitrospira sp.]
MMAAENREGVPYSAWGVSVGLHTLIVGLAFMITAQVQPTLKEEIFQWEVALVQPSPDFPQAETSQSTPTVQPSKPTPVRTVQAAPPIESTSDMGMTRVATPYSPEIVHPTVAPPKPESVQEIVQAKVQPVEPQEIKKEEIKKEEAKLQEVVKPEPVVREQHPAPVAREVAPPVEPVATAQAYEPPVAPASTSTIEHRSEVVGAAHAPPASPAAESAPAVSAASFSEAVVKEATSPAASVVAAAAAPVQTPAHHADAPVVVSAAPVRPATKKADNAWLAESLGRRIKELTRYPSSARLNGSEGKVVLRVILRADGHLVDVVVHRSSGHEVLDRAAMETVRLACPLHMKQALSAAEVAVYVPIVYSLAG